jgi:hypothetical protein
LADFSIEDDTTLGILSLFVGTFPSRLQNLWEFHKKTVRRFIVSVALITPYSFQFLIVRTRSGIFMPISVPKSSTFPKVWSGCQPSMVSRATLL